MIATFTEWKAACHIFNSNLQRGQATNRRARPNRLRPQGLKNFQWIQEPDGKKLYQLGFSIRWKSLCFLQRINFKETGFMIKLDPA